MKLKLLLVTLLLFSFLAKSQNLNDRNLMGEWKAVSVEIPNSNEVPQKESLKLIEDAFLNSKFNFKGNKVFRIKYGKLADETMKELVFIDNKNWIIKNNQILIGTENDGFSAMHITVQEIKRKTYFLLPMIRLEMEKLSDDKPSKPKVIEAKTKILEKVDYSKAELIHKNIDKSQIVEFMEAKNPPLAPDWESKWNLNRKKRHTKEFIQKHIHKYFDTDRAVKLGLTGRVKILMEFVFDTIGKPVNINGTGAPEALIQHAIDVIQLMPNLEREVEDVEPIYISYKISIIFQIGGFKKTLRN